MLSGRAILIGLLGGNIRRSLSPALHEDAIRALGWRGYYHLLDIEQNRGLPGELLEGARRLGFSGLNVTHPCKEAVLPFLDAISDDAAQIGAVNTIVIGSDGRMEGFNTDRIGFRRAFDEGLGADAAAGQPVLLLGAGGAGKALAYALFDMKVSSLAIFDADNLRAGKLAADIRRHIPHARCQVLTEIASLAGFRGIVNATPVGMLGHPGNPVPAGLLQAQHWVADIIYTPMETLLLRSARQAGARVLTGGGMLVHQAAESFRLFTGQVPDLKRMQRTFASALALRDAELACAG